MNKRLIVGLTIAAVSALPAFAQTSTPVKSDRVVVNNTMPPVQPVRTPAPIPPQPIRVAPAPIVVGQGQINQASNLTYKGLSFSQIKAKIAEAKRYLQTKPLTTAASDPVVFTSIVRVCY